MRLRHAAPVVLALLAGGGAGPAHAEHVGTTSVVIPRVALPATATISEGQARGRRVTLRCAFDACSYWIGPRDGTAKALRGDFDPFRIRQVDLSRGRAVPVQTSYAALQDDEAEATETFDLVVRTAVRDGDGPWHEREDTMRVRVLDTTPHRVDATRPARCYTCAP